jgi:hypothetical protein
MERKSDYMRGGSGSGVTASACYQFEEVNETQFAAPVELRDEVTRVYLWRSATDVGGNAFPKSASATRRSSDHA